MDLLAGLNPQQKEAVMHSDGALLILAGAGSGKTRVITHRMAYLVTVRGVPAPALLAVTFTNKAAGEMRERTLKLLGAYGGYGPTVSTFHSFCVRLLRQDGGRLADVRPGFTRNFTIYDDDEQLSIVKQIYRAIGLDEKFMQYRAALSRISHAKNHNESPQDFYKQSADPKMAKLAVVFEQYEGRLRQANALDFDDLLLESVRLLRHDAIVRDLWNRRISHLMIDEYQDTNRTQYDLMRLLSESHKNVCVVGDEDQSIYGWRGADIRNILDFEHDFPNARVIRLEQNYRSTKNILESAGAVVARNKQRKGKNLWTDAGSGERIGLYEAQDGEQEALFIADTIDRELARDPRTRIAVLYRTNSQSRQIEEALRRYNRSYIVVGGFSFYQRAEIKDALAYLKALASPSDSVNLLRIVNTPARGIGKTTVEEMERFAASHHIAPWAALVRMLDENLFASRAASALKVFRDLMEDLRRAASELPLDALLKLVLDRTGYMKMLEGDGTPESESKRQNLTELINAAIEATERGEDLAAFLDHAALVSDAESIDERAQISLLTMHNAKGLEFPVVFVAGMEEGLFPHSRARENETHLEEERRLCYVAMTRAERKLYLSWARYRRRFGGAMPEATIPSRFLNEVPASLLEDLKVGARATEVNLFGDRSMVRETVKRNLFTGKTYNSMDNIAQFFADRGVKIPERASVEAAVAKPAAPVYPPAAPNKVFAAPSGKKAATGMRPGITVEHPKYGRGTILRREGEGEDAKLTVSFPGYGLKKLVEKYAGFKVT